MRYVSALATIYLLARVGAAQPVISLDDVVENDHQYRRELTERDAQNHRELPVYYGYSGGYNPGYGYNSYGKYYYGSKGKGGSKSSKSSKGGYAVASSL